MAHAEPVSEKGMFFGFGKKVRRKVGSLMPLSISICRDCRRAMRFAEAIRWIVPLCVAAVATAAAVILRTGSDIVLAVLTLSLLAGYAAGRITSAAYVRAKSENIRFNPLEIPVIRDMKDAGWFMLDDRQRVVFSSKPHTKKISALSGGLNQTKGQC